MYLFSLLQGTHNYRSSAIKGGERTEVASPIRSLLYTWSLTDLQISCSFSPYFQALSAIIHTLTGRKSCLILSKYMHKVMLSVAFIAETTSEQVVKERKATVSGEPNPIDVYSEVSPGEFHVLNFSRVMSWLFSVLQSY